MWNFKKAFDRITEAYIQGNMYPLSSCACFIGNLIGETEDKWFHHRILSQDGNKPQYKVREGIKESLIQGLGENFYTPEEIGKLEFKFLKVFSEESVERGSSVQDTNEEALFIAMEKTLDLLKQIHISKGENVDSFEFKQRQLA